MGFEKTLLLKTPLARGFANVPLMKAPLVKHPCICWKKTKMCICVYVCCRLEVSLGASVVVRLCKATMSFSRGYAIGFTRILTRGFARGFTRILTRGFARHFTLVFPRGFTRCSTRAFIRALIGSLLGGSLRPLLWNL